MKPAASSPRCDGTLAVRKTPWLPASNRNRSVNVPPTSTPTVVRWLDGIAIARCTICRRGRIDSAVCAERDAIVASCRLEHIAERARRGRRSPASRVSGWPKPPPPGVSSRTCWPLMLISVTLPTSRRRRSPSAVS